MNTFSYTVPACAYEAINSLRSVREELAVQGVCKSKMFFLEMPKRISGKVVSVPEHGSHVDYDRAVRLELWYPLYGYVRVVMGGAPSDDLKCSVIMWDALIVKIKPIGKPGITLKYAEIHDLFLAKDWREEAHPYDGRLDRVRELAQRITGELVS